MTASFSGRRRRGRPRRPPARIGLTGSIGMGKTTVGAMLRSLNIPVFDADACVHRLTGRGGAALPDLAKAFPTGVTAAGLDRPAMAARAFADPAVLRRLEMILHPLVQAAERAFYRRCALARRPIAVSDIPLLFETGAQTRFDLVVVVSAPSLIQRQRVLARPGMTADSLDRVLARQWPDSAKRRAADVVVPTGNGKGKTRRTLARLLGHWKRHANRR